MRSPAVQRYWQRRARRLAFQVNLAWFFALGASRIGGAALLGTASTLVLRHLAVRAAWSVGTVAVLLGLAVLYTLWCLRLHRYGRLEALTRLDADLAFDGQLLSAEEGIADWPAKTPSRPVLSWRLAQTAPGLLLAPAMLVAAFMVPVEPASASKPPPKQGPLSWTHVQESLQVLQTQPLLAPAELDRWQAQLDELQALPSEDWFNHESQEAADTLLQQIRGSVARTENAVQKIEQALESALQATSDAEMAQAQRALKQALKSAVAQQQQMDPELAKTLKRLNPKDLPSMSREQLTEMTRKLAKARAAAQLARGVKPGEGDPKKKGPGQGLPKRGPGTAPIDLNPDAARRLSEARLDLKLDDDPSRDALGDLTRIDAVDPDADTSVLGGPARSGTTEHLGRGGAAVWRMRLLPNEQALLRKYFE